jgi:hypothetical protein
MKTIPSARFLLQAAAAAALLSATVLGSGCFVVAVGAGGAAGAGTVAWVEGALTVNLPNPYESVVGASNQALAQLQFFKLGEKRDALSDDLTARTAEDKKVEIKVTRVADNLTKLQIRVGTFGDKPLSSVILNRIQSDL